MHVSLHQGDKVGKPIQIPTILTKMAKAGLQLGSLMAPHEKAPIYDHHGPRLHYTQVQRPAATMLPPKTWLSVEARPQPLVRNYNAYGNQHLLVQAQARMKTLQVSEVQIQNNEYDVPGQTPDQESHAYQTGHVSTSRSVSVTKGLTSPQL